MSIPTPTLAKNVFCGKDKRLEEEEGNKIFKALILENVERYNIDNEKSRKMKMTAKLLEEFKIRSNGGMFFKECKGSNEWIKCDDGWVRDKVSHALRFQIIRKVQRPRLIRKLSLPDPPSPKKNESKERRKRSESFDSCPAKIETVSMKTCCGDWNIAYREDLIDESDPLILFEQMVNSGELDYCYSAFMYLNATVSTDTQADLFKDEILSDTEDCLEMYDAYYDD